MTFQADSKFRLLLTFFNSRDFMCLGVLLVHLTHPTLAVLRSGTFRPKLCVRGRDRGHGLAAALEPRRTGQPDRRRPQCLEKRLNRNVIRGPPNDCMWRIHTIGSLVSSLNCGECAL